MNMVGTSLLRDKILSNGPKNCDNNFELLNVYFNPGFVQTYEVLCIVCANYTSTNIY
jgi:hypothetical protein